MRARVIAQTNTTLGALAQYVGESEGVSVASVGDNDYIFILGYVRSDQDGTLEIWQSPHLADLAGALPTGRTAVITLPYVAAGGALLIDEPIVAPYAKVVFTNGAIQQTTFDLIARAIC